MKRIVAEKARYRVTMDVTIDQSSIPAVGEIRMSDYDYVAQLIKEQLSESTGTAPFTDRLDGDVLRVDVRRTA